VQLDVEEIPFGLWTEAVDEETGCAVPGLGNSRFVRFAGPVRLRELVIPALRRGGHLGSGPDRSMLPGRPRQVEIAGYDEHLTEVFRLERELPDALADGPIRVPLPDEPVCLARASCLRQYVGEAAFSLFHAYPWTVPFGLLADAQWHGEPIEPGSSEPAEPPWYPRVEEGGLHKADLPAGLEMTVDHYDVTYTGPRFTVGFSRFRPLLTCLGWDAFDTGPLQSYLVRRRNRRGFQHPSCGPYARAPLADVICDLLGGRLEIDGPCVAYRDVEILPGWTIDAEFTVRADGMDLTLRQRVDRELRLLAGGAWAFAFDGLTRPMISTLALPIRGRRRNGGVQPRGAWNVTGRGTLGFEQTGGAPAAVQTENTGFYSREAYSALQLGTEHLPDGSIRLQPGEAEATMRFDVRPIRPRSRVAFENLHPGLQRTWGTIFAFRPELGGFSNNGFSNNCKDCLYFTADMAAATDDAEHPFDLMELVKDAASLALRGGPGYGSCLEELSDTAPSLLIAAAGVWRHRPDEAWLAELWPFIERHVEHILGHRDERGLYINTRKSGNSGEKKWSSNAWDTMCFGHVDGMSNALAYRALREVQPLAEAAGRADLARRCAEVADRLKAAYVPALWNPDTGWLAAWQSADGQRHDAAYLFMTGIAVSFGLLEGEQARQAVANLEAAREAAGHTDFRYGFAFQLEPIPRADYAGRTSGEPRREDGRDTFGVFLNGGLSMPGSYFYLEALSKTGHAAAADQACRQMLDSLAAGVFDGLAFTGTEAYSWEGTPTGYEGMLTHSYHVLLAIARHMGVLAEQAARPPGGG